MKTLSNEEKILLEDQLGDLNLLLEHGDELSRKDICDIKRRIEEIERLLKGE